MVWSPYQNFIQICPNQICLALLQPNHVDTWMDRHTWLALLVFISCTLYKEYLKVWNVTWKLCWCWIWGSHSSEDVDVDLFGNDNMWACMKVSEKHWLHFQVLCHLSPEEGGSIFLQNIDIYLQVHMMLLPRRQTSTYDDIFNTRAAFYYCWTGMMFPRHNTKFMTDILHVKLHSI
jgi:hypothetical protein